MTIVSNEWMEAMRPHKLTVDEVQYAAVPGKKKPYLKIYRKHDDGWEYVTWIGQFALKVAREVIAEGVV